MRIFRYSRIVPAPYRWLRRTLRMRRPNWWIGNAEQPSVASSQLLAAQIAQIKDKVRRHVDSQTPAGAPMDEGASRRASETGVAVGPS
jgi:hypothetical protein